MRESKALLYEYARGMLSVTPAEEASLRLRTVTMRSLDQAYALAFALMAKADETWAR